MKVFLAATMTSSSSFLGRIIKRIFLLEYVIKPDFAEIVILGKVNR